MQSLIGIDEIRAAAERLQGVVLRTPLLENAELNQRCGGRVLIKPESLQRTGSFKIRGAYNCLAQIVPEQRAGGVVAWSSGNHAQGVAAAAAALAIPATIVMPADAPQAKRLGTLAFGAEIIDYDRYSENREEIGRALAKERSAAIIPPYDDYRVIAGQGTVGLELAQQCTERGIILDSALMACSGGGLVAGCAVALRDAMREIEVYAVEPDDFDDLRRSLGSGRRETNPEPGGSICDALLAPTPGELTFPIHRRLLNGALTVSDAEVLAAMHFAFQELKLVLEPSGAVPLAALLAGKIDCRDRHVAVVLSGGNIDPGDFHRLLDGVVEH